MCKTINRIVKGLSLSMGLCLTVAFTARSQSVTQSVPGPVCVEQSTQFVYSGGCPSQNMTWFLEGNTDATLTPAGTNMVNVTWHSAGATTVVAYCTSNPSLTGATSGLTVNASGGTPSVTIIGPSSICGGAAATYTASPTNGGSSPSYQWKVNGATRQNGASASFSPNDLELSDVVSVSMTSNKPCVTTPSANSNTITITNVTQPAAVSVTIDDPGPMCQGEETGISFTATPVNGGSDPQYQWYRNGSPAQDNQESEHGPEYRPYYAVQDGDNIRVEMTSDLDGCISGNPALSNLVTIDIQTPVTPSVSINYAPSIACEEQEISFTATSQQQITSYDWRINSGATMSTSAEFTTDQLHPGDVVYLTAGVTGECLSGTTAQASTSGILNLQPAHTATISPAGTDTIASDDEQLITASTGTAYTYQWTKDGNAISGATASTYMATEDGVYAVIISAPTGCTIPSNELNLVLNKLPVVDAGEPQTFHIPPNIKIVRGYAMDPENGEVTYLWTKESGPAVTLENTTTPNLVLKNPSVGNYVFRLTATDDFPESASETVAIVVEQLDNNYNWIKETVVLEEGADTMTDVNELVIAEGEKSVSYGYFDGLGRPMQNVSVQGSAGYKDLVQPIEYDQYGREVKKYLPYTDGTNGYFKEDALQDPNTTQTTQPEIYRSGQQFGFYQTGSLVASDQSPYAETRFEPSPLNRALEQGAPGTSWQPDGTDGYTSTDRSMKFSYEANEAGEVLLWTYVAPTQSHPLGLASTGVGSTPDYYAANELFKTKTKDEQHNEVIEFKDKLGRVLLKKVQAPDSEWAQTYYIYDDFGNLVMVIPPEAVRQMDDLFIENE